MPSVPPRFRRRRRRRRQWRRPARPTQTRVARSCGRRLRGRRRGRDRVLLERSARRFRARRHTGRGHERRRAGHRPAGPRGHQRLLGHTAVGPQQPQVVPTADHADFQVRPIACDNINIVAYPYYDIP